MMKQKVVWSVIQICYIMIVPCIGQVILPLDTPGHSNSDPLHKSRITATSLDHLPIGAEGSHPPVWIDPFSSGTFNPSQTPFFNWDSLMTSSSMSNMAAHGSGLIPTIQLGEGVPVSSVTDVTEITLDGKVNNEGKTSSGWVTEVHAAHDTKLPISIDSKNAIPGHGFGVPSANIPMKDTSDGTLLSHDTSPSTNIGVDQGKLSLDNRVPIDPTLLSPDNPAHADLIDFMITRDMALGIPDEAIKAPAIVQDPFETNQKLFAPTGIPHDIAPPDGAVITDSKLPETTNNGRKPQKPWRQTPKRQRQEERKQKKAMREQNRKNRNEQRKQKQELRQQSKQQRKARKQKFFSDKLVARKQRWKKERLQQKISKHIQKVDNLHQRLEQIEQQTPPGIADQVQLDKKAFITETNEKQIVPIVTNNKGSNSQNTKIQMKANKAAQNEKGNGKQNKRNRKVNNRKPNRKNKRKNGRRKWNRN